MKYVLYGLLLLGLVPVQTTILDHVGIGGLRPDLVLVAAVLIGFTMGPFEGLLMGLALGFVQDFFSASQLGLNLVTKGVSGFLGGGASAYMTNATPVTASAVVLVLSILSGLVFLLSVMAGEGVGAVVYGVWAILLPQAGYDAAVTAGVYWLIGWRLRKAGMADHGWARPVS